MTAHAPLPSRCENCAAPLHGQYCHDCGQSVHSPIRHFLHAVEEFFEAFWHLDGRLFRTLRDLLAPGRVAANYLAGHRARYIAPLRLFVVLSVLTFFIGQLTLHVDDEPLAAQIDTAGLTGAQTVAQVQRERERLRARIEEARGRSGAIPGLDAALLAAQVQIDGEAANRIAELRAAGAADVGPDGTAPPLEPAAAGAAPSGSPGRPQVADAAVAAPARPQVPSGSALFSSDNPAWDPARNPVRFQALPGGVNDWINGRLVQGKANLEYLGNHPDRWLQAFLGSVPSALFVLVPVFALMLKLAYLFTRRLYLEHLVVALYSHVFLLLALAVVFLLGAVGGWAAGFSVWFGRAFDLAQLLVLGWMPVYLLLMQKRVYAQGWPLTTLKFVVVGLAYLAMLALVAAFMFLVTLVQ